MNYRVFIASIAGIMVAATSTPSQADPSVGTVWSLATDFGFGADPNGAWEYGTYGPYEGMPFGAFTTMPIYVEHYVPQTSGDTRDYYTTIAGEVWYNGGTTTGFGIPPGDVSLNSDFNNTSVARWVAPASGTYNVVGGFEFGGGQGMRGLLLDGTLLWSVDSVAGSFSYSLNLNSGDTIDIADWNAVGGYGNTPVYETITLTSLPVPEPVTLALAVGGFAGLAGVRRKA